MDGVRELPLIEDASLLSGSPNAMTEVVNEDGSVSTVPTAQTDNVCPHNMEFFANPDYEQIIAAQQNEINIRNAEAAAAAAAAAQQANPEAPAPPPAQ